MNKEPTIKDIALWNKRVIFFFGAIMIAEIIHAYFGGYYGLVFILGYGFCEIVCPIKH